MTTEELERAILVFVNERLLHGKPSVDENSRLFEDGHLDSVRVLELISFIEQTTGRRVPDRSVRLATFRSVRAIALALGTSAPPADADEREPLYEYHTMPDRFASPIDELRRRGELVEFP